MVGSIRARAKITVGLTLFAAIPFAVSAADARAAPKTVAECIASKADCIALIEMTLLVSSSICMPDNPAATRDAAVVAWLAARPDRAKDDPITAINAAGHELWPCKK